MRSVVFVALVGLAGLSSACGIGRDRMVFATNTSIGVDLDTKPPKASLAYSRQELVIAPQYQGGHPIPAGSPASTPSGGRGANCATGEQVPSVLATIRNEFLAFVSKQSFLTGHAADLMAYGILKGDNLARDSIGRAYLSSTGTATATDEHKEPFFFGTSTVFGFDLRYNPATGLPDAAAVGFKRKELAILPLMEIASGKDVVVEVPSVFAGAAMGVDLKGGKQADGMQVFATGRAAEFLAASKSMRSSLLEPTLLQGELKKVEVVALEEEREKQEQGQLRLQVWGRYSLLADNDKTRMRQRAKELTLASDNTEAQFKSDVLAAPFNPPGGVKRSELMKVLLTEFP
jgi:hypothetical protein